MAHTDTTTKTMRCVVVTPEKAVLDEAVDFVAIPMFDGELGVMPGRLPLIGRLGYGELRLVQHQHTKSYYIDGGFAQIRDNVVTVLTSRAIEAAMIPVAKAEAVLHEARPTAQDQESHQRQQERARVQIRVAKKRADSPTTH